MRYPASEKLEIIRLVEISHQPVKKALEQVGRDTPICLMVADGEHETFSI